MFHYKTNKTIAIHFQFSALHISLKVINGKYSQNNLLNFFLSVYISYTYYVHANIVIKTTIVKRNSKYIIYLYFIQKTNMVYQQMVYIFSKSMAILSELESVFAFFMLI